MEAIRELDRPDWITLGEAAVRLDISRQAAGRAAVRLGFERRRVANIVLVSRQDVEYYFRTRQPSGPRKRPTPA